MEFNKSINHSRILYIFFIFLSLYIFFFSTFKVQAKAFEINNVEISKPFEINFDKNRVIDEGFRQAFFELISLTVDSKNKKFENLFGQNTRNSTKENRMKCIGRVGGTPPVPSEWRPHPR